MEIKKISESYNPIFKRREFCFSIENFGQGTPKLFEVRESLAEKYKLGVDFIYVFELKTETGTNLTYGKAEIYDSSDIAKKVVPDYIQTRNSSIRRKKKETKT